MNNDYRTDYGASSTSTSSNAKTSSESKSSESKSSNKGERHEGIDIRKYADEAKTLGKRFDAQITSHPYAVIGSVAGVAFIAGSVLGNRLGQLAVAIGLGYAATRLAQEPEVREIVRKAASAS
jgi:hypothetical protein